jgi:hypothetical protein
MFGLFRSDKLDPPPADRNESAKEKSPDILIRDWIIYGLDVSIKNLNEDPVKPSSQQPALKPATSSQGHMSRMMAQIGQEPEMGIKTAISRSSSISDAAYYPEGSVIFTISSRIFCVRKPATEGVYEDNEKDDFFSRDTYSISLETCISPHMPMQWRVSSLQ